MIVIDAGVLADYLLEAPAVVDAVQPLATDEGVLHAPELIDAEVLRVLRRFERSGQLPDHRAEGAVQDLAAVRVARHRLGPLRERVWDLRHELTANDAFYLALAESFPGARLLTGDRGLASRAQRSLGAEAVITV